MQTDLAGRPWDQSPFAPIIERAYAAIDAPRPQSLGVCDCCPSAVLMAEMRTMDRRQITAEHFIDWFFGAYDHPLPTPLWRYLLPRLMALLAMGEEIVDIELALSRYPTGHRKGWSADAWDAIDDWQREMIACVHQRRHHGLDTMLCMFATAGWPLESLTAQVLAWPDEALVSTLFDEWLRFGHYPLIASAFWEDKAAIMAFYTGDAIHRRIEAVALSERVEPDLARRAWELMAFLEMYRGRQR
ncbi:MAG: hypothetical protein AAF577_15740 [Pseudomonadota bacterium]